MALTLAEKKKVVNEVSQSFANASAIVIANYRGLKVSEMSQLREAARKTGVEIRVVKNTLSKRALEQTQFTCLSNYLVGPTVVALTTESPRDVARLLRDFAKDHEALEVKALSLGEELLSAEKIDMIANLPNKDEALAKLLFVMKEPIAKLARVLAEPQAKLVRLLAAIRDKKEAS